MATERPFVLDLREISADQLLLVGGKGLNLGLLFKAAFPVPDGFCVTSEAYSLVCSAGPAATGVQELAARKARSTEDTEMLAATIRAAILTAPVPPQVAEAVRTAYADLGGAVAVRSSATAEDLPTASFAGQQDTYLNIIGAEAVLDALRRCWASLWSARAVLYRDSLHMDHSVVQVAVLVQSLVSSRVSGVLFTANPLTGSRRQTVIDASPGLGEAVVSGAVNPDHFVVDTVRGQVVEQRLGDKRLRVQPRPEGGTEAVESPEPGTAACLSDRQIRDLAALGARVQGLFSAPQDVEWAIDGVGTIWLMQARPVTTLFPLPDGAPEAADDLRAYYSINASQGMETPFTPMGASLFRLLASEVAAFLGFPPSDALAGPSFIHEAGGRLFLDVTKALRSSVGRIILGAMTEAAESRASAALKSLGDDPRFSLLFRSWWPFVHRGVSFLLRAGVPGHLVVSLIDPRRARRRVQALRSRLNTLGRVTPQATPQERLRAVRGLFSRATVGPLLGIMPSTAVPAEALLSIARRLLGDLPGSADFEDVRRGVPDNPTTEMDLALWSLSEVIPPGQRVLFLETAPERLAEMYRLGSLPPPVHQALESFLGKHGHRSYTELDCGVCRWSEDPSPVFSIIANLLRSSGSGKSPGEIFRRSAETAREQVKRLVAFSRTRGRLRAAVVSFCLERARQLLGFREVPRFLFSYRISLARKLLLSVGRDLARDGRLREEEHVFFLTLGEVDQAFAGNDMRAVVAARRDEYARDLKRRAPAVVLSDGTVPGIERRRTEETGPSLQGLGASPGVVTGVARVILEPAHARLEPGEILVAPSTDPGWTPLFLIAAAVVTETGGPMAHGAIVARECGIPAVVAAADAATRIRSGMKVTVDGTRGIVTIL